MVGPTEKKVPLVPGLPQMAESSPDGRSIFRDPSISDLPSHVLKGSSIEPKLRGRILALLSETDLAGESRVVVLKLLLDQKSQKIKVKLIRELLHLLE